MTGAVGRSGAQCRLTSLKQRVATTHPAKRRIGSCSRGRSRLAWHATRQHDCSRDVLVSTLDCTYMLDRLAGEMPDSIRMLC